MSAGFLFVFSALKTRKYKVPCGKATTSLILRRIDLLVFRTAKKARAYGSAAVKIQEKSPYLHVLHSAK